MEETEENKMVCEITATAAERQSAEEEQEITTVRLQKEEKKNKTN